MKENRKKELTVKYTYKDDDEKFIKILYQIYLNNLDKLNKQKQETIQLS